MESSSYPLYYWGLILGVVYCLLTETCIIVPGIIVDMLVMICSISLTIHMFTILPRYSAYMQITALLIFISLIIIGINSDSLFLMFLSFSLVFGAKGIEYNKILKIYYKVGLVFCLTTLLLCYQGFIVNITDYGTERDLVSFGSVRNSFGYRWPTNLANHVFFICLAFWLYKRGQLKIVEILLLLLTSVWLIKYTDARLGAGSIILIIIFSFFLYIRKYIPRLFSNLLGTIVILWIPAAFALSLWTVYEYDSNSSDIYWIGADAILSGRLRIGSETLMEEGVTFWGQTVKMYGGNESGELYNYIDSSFLQAIIIYGVLFTVILLACFVYLSYRAYKRGDTVLLMAVFMSGLSGLVAQHFLQIFMNPLLIALVASHTQKELSEQNELCNVE